MTEDTINPGATAQNKLLQQSGEKLCRGQRKKLMHSPLEQNQKLNCRALLNGWKNSGCETDAARDETLCFRERAAEFKMLVENRK